MYLNLNIFIQLVKYYYLFIILIQLLQIAFLVFFFFFFFFFFKSFTYLQPEFRKCWDVFLNWNKMKTKRIPNHMSQYFIHNRT